MNNTEVKIPIQALCMHHTSPVITTVRDLPKLESTIFINQFPYLLLLRLKLELKRYDFKIKIPIQALYMHQTSPVTITVRDLPKLQSIIFISQFPYILTLYPNSRPKSKQSQNQDS